MKILNKLSIAALIFCFLCMITFLFMIFFPVDVIRPNVQPYKVLTPVVKVGGDLDYVVDACKQSTINGEITRTFSDGEYYPSITSVNNIPVGCHKTIVKVFVPNYIPPGNYHLNLDVAYQVNQLRLQYYHLQTEEFKVVK